MSQNGGIPYLLIFKESDFLRNFLAHTEKFQLAKEAVPVLTFIILKLVHVLHIKCSDINYISRSNMLHYII